MLSNCSKRKYKACHTVSTTPKPNIKIVERGKIDNLTQIYDRSLSWLGTHVLIKSGGVNMTFVIKIIIQT